MTSNKKAYKFYIRPDFYVVSVPYILPQPPVYLSLIMTSHLPVRIEFGRQNNSKYDSDLASFIFAPHLCSIDFEPAVILSKSII